jgi:hypothetical protein
MSRTRFTNTKRRNDNKLQYQSLVIPNFEERTDDTVIEINDYSRLDVLASDIFGDSTLWWVLASYNNLPGDSLYTTGVKYLRIPSDINIVYNKVKEVN